MRPSRCDRGRGGLGGSRCILSSSPARRATADPGLDTLPSLLGKPNRGHPLPSFLLLKKNQNPFSSLSPPQALSAAPEGSLGSILTEEEATYLSQAYLPHEAPCGRRPMLP